MIVNFIMFDVPLMASIICVNWMLKDVVQRGNLYCNWTNMCYR